ncbi:hypothetical protein SAMN05421770_102331 [Granulicella rosea]|uniref:Uncharacterized protein n=1 Tax=Granulicella rosea TaxID=474952 RepID=A0A239HBT5_9BACT|nr:hypothetical protein SAMN05421770_102331 [Granulicella rosea]
MHNLLIVIVFLAAVIAPAFVALTVFEEQSSI